MYLTNQHRLPRVKVPGGTTYAPWRLHFEYKLENKDEAEAHAAVCRRMRLPVRTDEQKQAVRRRQTIAVLAAADEQHHETVRFTGSAACSWTDTFNKETGRRTALQRLEERLNAGAESRLTPEEGKLLANGARHVYNQRLRYKPLREALQLLRKVDTEAEQEGVTKSTRENLKNFLKQFGQ